MEDRVPQGTPKSSPNRPTDPKNRLQGVLRRPLGKDVEKTQIFRTLGTVKMRLPLTRELNFHFFQGTPKDSQNGAKIELKSLPNPSGDALRSLRESSRKWIEKSTRNRSPRGIETGPQIRPKIDQKYENAFGAPFGSQDR